MIDQTTKSMRINQAIACGYSVIFLLHQKVKSMQFKSQESDLLKASMPIVLMKNMYSHTHHLTYQYSLNIH